MPSKVWGAYVIEFASTMMMFFGMIVAVIVGIGAVLNDSSPSLNTFWRSRPIRPDLMFWTQFAVGGAVLLLTFGLPVQALALLSEAQPSGELEPYMLAALMLCAFALAVGFTAVTRHAIYSAILALGGALAAFVFAAEKITIPAMGNAFLLTVALTATLVGWVCFRNDWALRS